MMVNIPLAGSRYNAGETAWATLVGRGDQTDATITASGVPSTVTRPVHLYTYIHEGECGALSAQPAYSLTRTVLARAANAMDGGLRAPYVIGNTADVPLATLRSTPHAIVVRSAPADGDWELFCGDIASAGK
jgi:hypothetical protein